MKKIILFFVLTTPVLGFGQAAGNYEAPAPAAMAMASNFTSASLTDDQLEAFQQRASQKLQDFYDYLAIISNRSYEKQMREDAKKQAKQLFYGSDCSVNGEIAMTFIDSCFNAKDKITWKAVNIKVKEKMKAKSDVLDSDYYEGILTFTISGSTDSRERTAYIMLAKSKKQFGASNREVWTALICDIR